MSNKNILKKLSPIHIVAFVCAVVLLATVITASVIFIVNAVKDSEREFDYLSEDLGQYITVEDFDKLTINPEYNTKRDVDIEHEILSLVASQKEKSSAKEPGYASSIIMSIGDQVNMYYRGWIENEVAGENEGETKIEKNYVDGMTNLTGKTYQNMTPHALTIGGDSFIPGFSLALDGLASDHFTQLERNINGAVDNTMVAFVSYTRYPVTYNPYSGEEVIGAKESATSALIDLREDNKDAVNEAFGTGVKKDFYDLLLYGYNPNPSDSVLAEPVKPAVADGKNLVKDSTNGYRYTIDGVEYKYTSISVEYTVSATALDSAKYITVEFPANYGSEELAGKTAYFAIFVESVVEYEFEGQSDAGDVTYYITVDGNKEVNKTGIDSILKEALKDNEDFKTNSGYVAFNEGEEDTNAGKYYDLYRAYLVNKYAEDNKVANKNATYQAIIDALVAKTTLKLDNATLKAMFDEKKNENLVTIRQSYESYLSSNSLDSKTYTINTYVEENLGYTDEEFYTTKTVGDEEFKVYNWEKAIETLTEEYFKERMVVYYLIQKNNLANDEAYKAAYNNLLDEYKSEYKKSYCSSNGYDIDNLTALEAQKVDAAVKSYIESQGYDYFVERAYYQLVFSYLLDGKVVGEEGVVIIK